MNKYQRIFNFSAGPAILPEEVLEKAAAEMLNYKNSGMSIMEMSHRSKVYMEVIESAEAKVRQVMNIPEEYAVLFLQGGASLQFSMIPMNLYQTGKPVDLLMTGAWAQKAAKEIKRVGQVNVLASSEDKNFSYIPDYSQLAFNPEASFFYITSNNTIEGTQFKTYPKTGNVPLIADMSSDIMSHEIDIRQFGMIYAGAQKNLGPSGLTLVIIRKDLIERASDQLPTMLQYRTHAKEGSMYNTPPTFGIYILGLVMEWILANGGLKALGQRNAEKAALLYQAIDESPLFYCPVEPKSRSNMNIVFRVKGDREELETQFIQEAKKAGLIELKGHRSVGGLRASLYNAMPLAGVQALVACMADFAAKNK